MDFREVLNSQDLYSEYRLRFVRVARLEDGCGGKDEPSYYEPESLNNFSNFPADDVDIRF